MLQLKNVTKIYQSKSGNTTALNNVNLTFPDSGLVFILGKSGSGKTTMLNAIGGLDSIDSGDIIIDGKKFSEFTEVDYDNYRNTYVGFIFQEYNLLSEYTVEKNVTIANELQGATCDEKELENLFELVDINGLQKRKISELSGGQKQRVAIARALIKNPGIIIADEPTGAIDSVMGVQIMDILKKLSKDKLVVVVSHDTELAEKYADRIVRIADGVIVEDDEIITVSVDGNVRVNDNGDVIVRKGKKLSDEEANTVVNAIEKGVPVTITDDIVIKDKNKTDNSKIKKGENKTLNLIKSKMKLKSLAYLGAKSLFVKPFRLIVTIFLSVVAFAVFGIFDTVAAYNRTNIVADSLKRGDYSAIPVSMICYGDEGSYNVGLSEDRVKALSDATGYSFKPVYSLAGDFTYSVNNRTDGTDSSVKTDDVKINQIADRYVQKGQAYYTQTASGIVEFDEKEVDRAMGKIDAKGFNFRLIAGSYPSATDESWTKEEKTDNLKNVAISSYLADSLIHYGMRVTQGTGSNATSVAATSYEQLIGQEISMYGYGTYVITGIVDCGDLNEKFDVLKTAYNNEVDKALKSDFKTTVNAGFYKCLFVCEKYVDTYREINYKQTGYVGGNYNYYGLYDGLKSKKSLDGVFYNFNDFDVSKIVYFDDERNKTGRDATLEDDEVIINAKALKSFYDKEITDAIRAGKTSQTTVDAYVGVLEFTKEQMDKVGGVNKKETMNALMQTLFGSSFEYKNITLSNQSKTTFKESVPKTYKVVGIFWNVDCSSTDSGKHSRILMTENALDDFGICSTQGYYSRMVAKKINNNSGVKTLAEMITCEESLGLNWYGNGILSIIEYNKETISQFANLFLYVSLALALFSVFMLFNYISTSITSKRRSIGVLRGLGSNGFDIFKMFFIESLIIAVTIAIFSIFVAMLGCVFVNTYINNVMNIQINFALFTWRQVIVISAAAIVTAIASSVIPILNIAKEKPVNLIVRSN